MKSEMISYVGHAFCLSLISLGLLCSDETGTSLIKRKSVFRNVAFMVVLFYLYCGSRCSSGAV